MATSGAAAHERLVDAIRAALAAAGDPARAVQQQVYMKSAMPYRGVATDVVRRVVAGELDRPEHRLDDRRQWESALLGLWDAATHREERYAAIAIARHRSSRRHRTDGALGLYRHMITTGAWWDLVDEVATHLVRDELLAAPTRVTPELRRWALDPDLWVRRAAILGQIGAKQRVDLDLLGDTIQPNLEGSAFADRAGRQDFFIRKAIGWALRDAARQHPEWVRAYVDEHRDRMAGLTVREALKHLDGR
jgi:3-methyladenine DNA glycosylase AlkD